MNLSKNHLQPSCLASLFAGLLFCLVSMSGWAQISETVTYYHTDALGSIVAASDDKGEVIWRRTYTPYGERFADTSPEGAERQGFTGKPHDSDLGLSYFGARWYDPKLGRFMGMDPVGVEPGNIHSFNRYAYANNNPYRYVDPDGEFPLDTLFFFAQLGMEINNGNLSSYYEQGSTKCQACGTSNKYPLGLPKRNWSFDSNFGKYQATISCNYSCVDDKGEKFYILDIRLFKQGEYFDDGTDFVCPHVNVDVVQSQEYPYYSNNSIESEFNPRQSPNEDIREAAKKYCKDCNRK